MDLYTNRVTHEGHPGMGCASFHAYYHRESVERELAACPPGGRLPMLVTASTNDGFVTYDATMPRDDVEEVAFCRSFAATLFSDDARAAGASYTVAPDADGYERMCVIVSDREGGEQTWLARVMRSETQPPKLAEWERVAGGSMFMFMLHAAVSNDTGLKAMFPETEVRTPPPPSEPDGALSRLRER